MIQFPFLFLGNHKKKQILNYRKNVIFRLFVIQMRGANNETVECQ